MSKPYDLDLTEAIAAADREIATYRPYAHGPNEVSLSGDMAWGPESDMAANAIAAAAPIIAKQVRESASAEILARKIPVPSNNLGLIANDALILAARIAREGK